MEEAKVFTREQKTESLRKALIEAGYDMASSQVGSMEEDTESWGENMIEGKITPNALISVTKQATLSTTMSWIFGLNLIEIFPEGCGEWGLNELIGTNGISDDEVFDLLYEGANNYINKIYGKDWKEKYPEPKYK